MQTNTKVHAATSNVNHQLNKTV